MRDRKLIVCVVVAAVLAACGGDTADEPTTASDADTTTTVADTTTTTTTMAATTTTTDGGSDGDSSGDGSPSAVCLEATQAMATAMSSYTTGMTGVMSGNLDTESLELAAGQLQAMAEAAPDEIRDELTVIATELGKFYEALAEIDFEAGAVPTPEQSEELAALAESVDQQAFDEAAVAVELWFEENC